MAEQFETTGVLESCRWVMGRARHVRIAREAVESLAERFASDTAPPPSWHSRWHWFDPASFDCSALAILALDAVNFCFWGADEATRWRVRIGEAWLQGYWACAACCKRAIEAGKPLHDPAYLSELTLDEVAGIFAGDELAAAPIPLLPERLAALREVGQVLRARYRGSIAQLLGAADGSAIGVTLLLARHFRSFDDVAWYQGRAVRFYKRAQIYAADLHGAYDGKPPGALRHMDRLTAFADYKVPLVLRRYGVLEYAPDLSRATDRTEPIPPGDPREIEIRAATVCAVEDVRTTMHRRGVARTAPEIDWQLWLLGQEPHPDDRPYHRTRTIFY